MDKHLYPIASAFATVEQAGSYDRWFRAKVLVSLDDQRPCAPHDEVMARMRELIDVQRGASASGPMAR